MLYNSVVGLLDKASVDYADKTALVYENESVTYKEYRRLALNVATGIINHVGKEKSNCPVIVCMKKSYLPIIAFMGVLYSGNSYVPVPADVPETRLSKITENLNPVLVICDENTVQKVSSLGFESCLFSELVNAECDVQAIELKQTQVIDTDPAYMIYTSGSTGVPKGVTVCHKSIVDYALWTKNEFSFTQDDVFGNQAPFYFDNSVFDIYTCLITGAKLVIISEVLFMFPSKLPEFVRDNGITTIFWVPTVMLNVAYSKALQEVSMPKLKRVLFAGEVMPNTALNIWRKSMPEIMYANLYGPTEITDVCIFYVVDREFEDSEPLPIGKPCKNMRAYILDENGKEVARGQKGELYISGTGLALGYYNAPEITAKAFVQNPMHNKYRDILYKTGDIAYYSDDGLIMYAGRTDAQIKVKGNRIELGEIENAACCVDGVENACGVFDAENEQIVLFVKSKNEYKLRSFNVELKKHIPAYMLPGKLRVFEELPLTPSGKIDRVKLKKEYVDTEEK